MNPELFPAESVAVPSPRLRWFAKHGVQTHFCKEVDPDETEPWSAWSGDLQTAIDKDTIVLGLTEDDVLCAWAKANNVRMWNEEGL